jgi:transcriptional regulator GlxA family with amidase domain
MGNTTGILLFEGVEELDAIGPWEVLKVAVEGLEGEKVLTVAEKAAPIVCEKGMRIIPDHTYAEISTLDVLLIPGGSGARRETDNPATTEWLQAVANTCTWVTSVCTGAFLVVGSGLASGRRITTHHDFISALRKLDGAEVIEGVRYVRDGNLVTAAGVMSGIEMSLWLVEELYGSEVLRRTKSYIAYDYPPRD